MSWQSQIRRRILSMPKRKACWTVLPTLTLKTVQVLPVHITILFLSILRCRNTKESGTLSICSQRSKRRRVGIRYQMPSARTGHTLTSKSSKGSTSWIMPQILRSWQRHSASATVVYVHGSRKRRGGCGWVENQEDHHHGQVYALAEKAGKGPPA